VFHEAFRQLISWSLCRLVYWLPILQVASAQHPSGLALHSAASFRRTFGFEPAAYPDYLALVGKKEASIPSVGMSSKLAKTLLAKCVTHTYTLWSALCPSYTVAGFLGCQCAVTSSESNYWVSVRGERCVNASLPRPSSHC